jgi:hypothetical protein
MRDLLRFLARQFDRLAYHAYRAALKVAQQPQVRGEMTPRILSDEVLRPAEGKAYAIIVKYAAFRVDEDFLDLLDALRRARVNAIVVCNGTPRPAELQRLRGAAQRILIRPNIGRDMGGYRAASLHLAGLDASRVLYFNDSVFYLRGAELDRMVAALLTSDYDVTGTFENHEYFHHVGSFAFSMAGEVFADPRVAAFWRDYKPYDLRPHAIIRGELGLARCLKAAGYRMDVLYSADLLAARLDAMPVEELANLLRYVPASAQRISPASMLREPLETRHALRDFRPDPPGRQPTSALRGLADQMEREALVNQILRTFIDTSQVHFGFGVFRNVLSVPLMKKDLLTRGVFLEHEVARILEDLPDPQRAAILRELITRGRPVRMGFVRRFQARHGLI